ncbi:MAG: VanW family protein [Micropruina sp.]|uniref:VanW family protein n=1 Tax=Micropruina sp. TaxID=2737536 RepID=UPI0039E3DC9A
MSTTDKPVRRGRRLALWVTGGALVVLGGGYVAGHALAGDKTPRNATVAGIGIGGMSADAAAATLQAELGPRLSRELTVTAGTQTLRTAAADLGLGIDYAATVARSGAGRTWNPADIVTVLTGGGEQRPVVTRDEATLTAAVSGLAAKAESKPTNAGLSVKGTTIVRSEGKPGVAVQQPQTADAIAGAFIDSTTVAAVVAEIEPEISTAEADQVANTVGTAALGSPIAVRTGSSGSFQLTPAMIAAALRFEPDGGTLKADLDADKLTKAAARQIKGLGLKRPKDATITIAGGKPKIVASVDGIGIEPKALASGAASVLDQGAGRSITVEATVQKAKFTTADAKKLGVKEITGAFTTYYPGSAYRVNNIGKAARMINGTFLKPGETFSMNATLGKRTAAAGWMRGGGIANGKIDPNIYGGGISQATTTTFNAIFFAGLEDIYHKPHSLYFDRYPVGREATLDWVSVDMKFRNDSPYGVVLQAWTTGKVGQTGSVTVRVWSTKRYTVKASTAVRSNYRSPGPTQYDPSPGCVSQSAMSGFDVRFNRLFYQGKKLVKTEPFFWRYNTLTPVVCGKKP